MNTRQNLKEVIQGHLLEEEEGSLLDGEGSPFLKLPEIPDLNSTAFAAGPKLYVRDDGTVDWEGALQDRAALRKFGGAVWARINGQTPDDFEEEGDSDNDSERERETASTHETKEAVTAKIEETEAIQEARSELHRLRAEYKEMQKAHTALLSTGRFRPDISFFLDIFLPSNPFLSTGILKFCPPGISAGQPVANVKLAALDPALRNKIRLSAEALLIMEQQVSYQSLVYDLERIYTYLAAELGNPASKGYIPLQDRLNVAEVSGTRTPTCNSVIFVLHAQPLFPFSSRHLYSSSPVRSSREPGGKLFKGVGLQRCAGCRYSGSYRGTNDRLQTSTWH